MIAKKIILLIICSLFSGCHEWSSTEKVEQNKVRRRQYLDTYLNKVIKYINHSGQYCDITFEDGTTLIISSYKYDLRVSTTVRKFIGKKVKKIFLTDTVIVIKSNDDSYFMVGGYKYTPTINNNEWKKQ